MSSNSSLSVAAQGAGLGSGWVGFDTTVAVGRRAGSLLLLRGLRPRGARVRPGPRAVAARAEVLRAASMSAPAQHSADLALTRAAAAGDVLARERLFQRLECVPRFLASLNRRSGSPLDRTALEDLAQTVLMLVWQKLPDYRGDAAVESWVFRFCLFQTLNAVRSARRRDELLRSAQGDGLAVDRIGVTMPLDGGLVLEELEALMASLAPREAQVLRLRHLEDSTLPEIAGALGISVSSVKTHYYRGLEKLRLRLAPRKESNL